MNKTRRRDLFGISDTQLSVESAGCSFCVNLLMPDVPQPRYPWVKDQYEGVGRCVDRTEVTHSIKKHEG